jgi:hypothetical protein
MPSALPPSADPTVDARTERRLARVEELAELAMGMARLVSAQAHAEPQKAGELSLQFARIARAVRQTLALEAHFCEPQPAAAPPRPEEVPPWTARGMSEADYRAAKRAANRRFESEMIVGRAIEREADARDDESLLVSLADEYEDLTEPELFASDASLAEIIAGICADLGIAPRWDEWKKKDWGALAQRERIALRCGARPFRPSELHARAPESSPALAEAP